MATPAWTVALCMATAVLAAAGQLLFKHGAAGITAHPATWLLNLHLMGGLALHGLGFVLLVVALKFGRLSVLFPVLATSYVWTALLAARYLDEPVTRLHWAGISLILLGVFLVTR